MLKQILLAATALTIVAGTTALTRAADADDTARVATELNNVIAKANPGADNRSIVVEGDAAAAGAPQISANPGDLPNGANIIVNPTPGANLNQIVPGAEV